MRFRFRRSRDTDHDAVSRSDAVSELHALEHAKERLDKYDENPNDGYHTPFNSTVYPGLDI